MRLRPVGLSLLLITLALGVFVRSIARADQAPIEASLDGEKTTIDKDKTLHLDVAAHMNAPASKVYDALTHPETVAKYDADITSIKVVAHDAKGKTVEYKGQTLPIPNAPPSFRVQYSFDPAAQTVSAQNAGKSLINFHTHTELKPSKDGKGTDIHYTSVSSYPGPIGGVDPPDWMRSTMAINTFMRQMHNVARYIESGGH